MKLLLSNKTYYIFISLFIILILSGCCKNKQDTFMYISDEAKMYIPDTCEIFYMIDNYGITEPFQLTKSYNYYTNEENYHNFIVRYQSDEDRCGNTTTYEYFSIEYLSSLNNFFFNISIYPNIETNMLQINWNQYIYVSYTFETGEIEYQVSNEIIEENLPLVTFIDNFELKDTIMNDVMYVDFSNVENTETPLKIYVAPHIGLVKYILRNDVEAERVF